MSAREPVVAAARPRRLATTSFVVGLIGLHTVLSRSMDGFLLADGTGYLANARWLVDEAGTTWQGPAAFYHAGWSLLVAPIYLVTLDPSKVYDSVLVLNAVLASLSFAAYAALARTVFGLRPPIALLAGLVAAAYPAVLLQASFEWSESLFHLLFPVLILCGARLLRTRSMRAAMGTALVAAALNATHPKGLGAVGVVALWLVYLGARRAIWRRSAIAGLVVLAAAFIGTRLLHGALQDALYDESAAAIEGDVLNRITDPTLVWGSFKRLWGQLWYLTVASVGLFPLGVVHVVRERNRKLAALLLGTALAILAASCLQMSDGTRVDHIVYGRYDEGFLPTLLVAGAAGLVARREIVLRLLVVGAWLSAALGGLAVALNGTSAFSGNVMPLNVVGVLVYRFDIDEIDVLMVTILALVPLIVVALATRRGPRLGLSLLAMFFIGSSLSVEARTLRPWEDFWSSTTEIPEIIHDIGADGPVAYDLASYDVDAADLYQLELTDLGGVVFFDSRREAPPREVVIAGPQWSHPGARMVFPESPPFRQALWVLPGDLQRRLAFSGALVPEQTSAPLPVDAQSATLTVDDDELRMHRFGSTRVTAHIQRTGAGATWLPVGPIPAVVDGTVRLGARWYDAAGNEVASQTAELPRAMLPGEEADVPIELVADVPLGTYRVTLTLRQEAIDWWDESAVELRVTVTR